MFFGYAIYGRLVENIYGADPERIAPAIRMADGVDFVVLPAWKIFLIQFLNIAGLGPIFGAIAGAMFGPSAFLWIVLGSIFAGGVHDYLTGMLSVRHDGLNISEIVGIYLGSKLKYLIRVFTIVLLIFVGTVFLVGPAEILAQMTNNYWDSMVWVFLILVFYIASTLLPIDKIIGRIYPIFGLAMLVMTLGLIFGFFIGGYTIPEVTFSNLKNFTTKPSETPIFPILFVTIACGAISGFHATQSPLMARCMQTELLGRKIFFGSMVTEGVVALIWAAAAMVFFDNVQGLNIAMNSNNNNAAWAANEITRGMLGNFGGILALLGLVAAPLTSGDTAFRSARLIIADILKLNQTKLANRLRLSIPLFLVAVVLTQIDFGIIWRYFAWSNQTLAAVSLWAVTSFLIQESKFYWISLIPAVFMTLVCSVYIFIAPEGFDLSINVSYLLGALFTLLIIGLFLRYMVKINKNDFRFNLNLKNKI